MSSLGFCKNFQFSTPNYQLIRYDEPETSRTSGRSSLSEGNFKSVRALNAAKRYMETHSSHPASRSTESAASSVSSAAASSAGSSSCGLQEGMKIEHQRFGRGTVLKIEGTGENTKATVEFVHSGTKHAASPDRVA